MTEQIVRSSKRPALERIDRHNPLRFVAVLLIASLCGAAASFAAEQDGTPSAGVSPSGAAPAAASVNGATAALIAIDFEGTGDGNIVADRSGNGRDGRIEGEVTVTGSSAHKSLGAAATLTDGGRIRVPRLGDKPLDAFTIEVWLRLDKPVPGGIAAIFAADDWKPGFVHFNLKSNGAIELAINGAGAYPNSAAGSVVPGRWTFLTATFDRAAGRQRVFQDGRLLIDAPASSARSAVFPAGTLGAWYSGGRPTRPLPATIDGFAVYNRAFSPGEVRLRYLRTKGVPLEPVDFATDIRPILQRRCFECHGPDTQESGLRLDVRDSVFRGGESGEPAVLPFDAEHSHLVMLVTASNSDKRMPPDGPPLTAEEIKRLRNWIDQGAAWPDDLAGSWQRERLTTDHWSYQPVRSPQPPPAEHPFVVGGNAVDAFVFRKLAEAGLSPSPQADRRTLIRRLYLDVHGLPPTPEEVAEFLADDSPNAWPRLVDRVLASPRYGERWASHWLDVIRYGDTHGFEVNTPRANAWPYRDYVIRSLNDDKPFDRFIREQIVGDQLGVDAATGFLVAAPALLPGQVGKDEPSKRQARSDELDEILVTVSEGVLGMTLHCARCHNHKFDPLEQQDYYRFAAFFAGVRYGDRSIRNAERTRLAPETPLATAVFGGQFATPEPMYRLYRGDPMQRRERVAPDVPRVFGTLGLESLSSDAERRKALAAWLTAPDNPLTPRVIANRIWQHHFGRGIVATPSDFGRLGARPTHPELLDFLAATLIRERWSLKALHRLILRSNTYRQSSRPRSEAIAVDAQAALLWRFPPRRLAMEPIRDSILAVSGALNLKMGGPGFSVFKPNTNYVRVYEPRDDWGPEEFRRMIYVHRVRMERDGVFGEFDCPDAGQPAPQRGRSTTALQALNLLNSSFIKQQADRFAARVRDEAGGDVRAQIDRAFQLAYGRPASAEEIAAARSVADTFGLSAVCRALFNTNEFLTIP